jgi:mono/diheme cytochrome c family protein
MRARMPLFGVLLMSATQLVAQQPAKQVNYEKDVQPILDNNCIGCHSGSSASAGLSLDSAALVLRGTPNEKVVVPGDVTKSVLIQRISDTTGNGMPPEGPLTKQQIATITNWVAQGAKVSAAAEAAAAAPEPALPTTPAPPSVSKITSPTVERAMLNHYCVTCHHGVAAPQGMKLDELDTAHVEKDAEKWEKVVRKLRAGMMPPSGRPRPDAKTYEAMAEYLEHQLDAHAVTELPPPGLHRMNRSEYANAIQDLLDLQIDPTKFLPGDNSTRGFDNVAAGLTLSPALLEGYISAAGKISHLAVGDTTGSKNATQSVFRVPGDATQDYHVAGLPFGTRGGLVVNHIFPADGQYKFKIYPVNKGNMDNNQAFGEILHEKLELLVDGKRIKLYDWDTEVGRGAPVHGGTAPVIIPVTAGAHTVGVTFLATNYAPGSDLDEHFLRSTLETGGLPGFTFYPHVGKLTIDGPYDATGAKDSPSRDKIFVCHPQSADQDTACAKKILSTLARRAYRRPVTDQDMEMLMSFYQQGRNEGGDFDHGIELGLRRILADPEFVFRKEVVPANVAPGKPYRITDLELASRLSFFLWSSIPDDELLNLAAQNKLHEPAVLKAQVRRMLADPRSDRMIDNFAGQWLNLRLLPTITPVPALFPNFDDNLRQAMRREVELFVQSIVHEDRSALDLLNADYTFVNGRLAKHYGIPNIYGSNFRRVELGKQFDMRRGLLGKAAIETVTSYPNRTSPTVRGKDIMEIFLGVSPPPPPPNVVIKLVASSGDAHGAKQPSMREQMEMHRKNEPCHSCHKIMDPIGLSLENFDAIGHWRTEDGGNPIDATGQLVDGVPLDGVEGMRAALNRYSPEFLRVLAEKLMIFGLGRGTEYYDMPLVRSIVYNAAKDNYRFSDFILGVVESKPFQMNMKPDLEQRASR